MSPLKQPPTQQKSAQQINVEEFNTFGKRVTLNQDILGELMNYHKEPKTKIMDIIKPSITSEKEAIAAIKRSE